MNVVANCDTANSDLGAESLTTSVTTTVVSPLEEKDAKPQAATSIRKDTLVFIKKVILFESTIAFGINVVAFNGKKLK